MAIIESNLDLGEVIKNATAYGPYGPMMPEGIGLRPQLPYSGTVDETNFYHKYVMEHPYPRNLYYNHGTHCDILDAGVFLRDIIDTYSIDTLSGCEIVECNSEGRPPYELCHDGTINFTINKIGDGGYYYIKGVSPEFIKAMSICLNISADIDTVSRIIEDESQIDNYVLANQNSI